MIDQEVRLRLAEQKLETHGKLHEETQNAIKSMAAGIQQLALAETRREQDRETFSRVFAELRLARDEINVVRNSLEEYKDKVLEKELAAYQGIVWKLLGLVSLVIVSAMAGHFGIKLIGG